MLPAVLVGSADEQEAGFQVMAFQRFSEGHRLPGKFGLFSIPSAMADLPIKRTRLGTRMEFLLKNSA